jgi:hypothetical protein
VDAQKVDPRFTEPPGSELGRRSLSLTTPGPCRQSIDQSVAERYERLVAAPRHARRLDRLMRGRRLSIQPGAYVGLGQSRGNQHATGFISW